MEWDWMWDFPCNSLDATPGVLRQFVTDDE